MKNILLFGLILFASFFQEARAQTELNGRLLILHEGTDGVPGELGYQSLGCNYYRKADSLPIYSNALYEHGDTLFVTDGYGSIVLYERRTLKRLHTLTNANVREVMVWRNFLLSTCNKAPFFRVYDLNDQYRLVFKSELTHFPNETEGLAVSGNFAFIAMNGLNGFGVNKKVDSTVVIFSLTRMRYHNKLFSYPNPNKIIETDGKIYVQCLDYGARGLTVTAINPENLSVEKHFETGKLSAGGFAPNGDEIYFLETDPNTFTTKGIRSVNVKTWEIKNELEGNFYGMDYLPKYNAFVTSQTDFFSSGSVGMYSRAGDTLKHFNAKVSPRAFLYQDLPEDSIKAKIITDVIWGGWRPENIVFAGEDFNATIETEDEVIGWEYTAKDDSSKISGTEKSFQGLIEFTGSSRIVVKVRRGDCEETIIKNLRVVIRPFVADLIFPSAEIKYLPQSQSVEVSYRAGEVQGLQLMDVQGRVLHRSRPEFGSEKSTISVSGYAQGIYLLRLENAQGTVTKKIWVE